MLVMKLRIYSSRLRVGFILAFMCETSKIKFFSQLASRQLSGCLEAT
jgi:hypothetical protein